MTSTSAPIPPGAPQAAPGGSPSGSPDPRFAAILARVEADRAAFLAAGGGCIACRDRGRRSDGRPCPWCDRGLALVEAEAAAARSARLAAADLAPFAGRTLDTWPGPPGLVGALRHWADAWGAERPFLLLHGPTGGGKSSLAAALLAGALRRTDQPGWRVVAAELIRRLRPVEDQDQTLAVRAATVPLLVLDDLGVTRPTDWVEEQLYGIVNERYERRRWTVITTNHAADDFAARDSLLDRLGPRIFWRIHELALAVEVDPGNLRDR